MWVGRRHLLTATRLVPPLATTVLLAFDHAFPLRVLAFGLALSRRPRRSR